jgi:hypothetical protein
MSCEAHNLCAHRTATGSLRSSLLRLMKCHDDGHVVA